MGKLNKSRDQGGISLLCMRKVSLTPVSCRLAAYDSDVRCAAIEMKCGFGRMCLRQRGRDGKGCAPLRGASGYFGDARSVKRKGGQSGLSVLSMGNATLTLVSKELKKSAPTKGAE